jgi:hypothetical protein
LRGGCQTVAGLVLVCAQDISKLVVREGRFI